MQYMTTSHKKQTFLNNIFSITTLCCIRHDLLQDRVKCGPTAACPPFMQISIGTKEMLIKNLTLGEFIGKLFQKRLINRKVFRCLGIPGEFLKAQLSGDVETCMCCSVTDSLHFLPEVSAYSNCFLVIFLFRNLRNIALLNFNRAI
jgi:hypothetical protein